MNSTTHFSLLTSLGARCVVGSALAKDFILGLTTIAPFAVQIAMDIHSGLRNTVPSWPRRADRDSPLRINYIVTLKANVDLFISWIHKLDNDGHCESSLPFVVLTHVE